MRVRRRQGTPSWGLGAEPSDQNYFEKSLLQISERERSTHVKEVGRVHSFKLRAKSESRSEVAAWYHSEVPAWKLGITPEEHSKTSKRRNTLKRQCRAAPQRCITEK